MDIEKNNDYFDRTKSVWQSTLKGMSDGFVAESLYSKAAASFNSEWNVINIELLFMVGFVVKENMICAQIICSSGINNGITNTIYIRGNRNTQKSYISNDIEFDGTPFSIIPLNYVSTNSASVMSVSETSAGYEERLSLLERVNVQQQNEINTLKETLANHAEVIKTIADKVGIEVEK